MTWGSPVNLLHIFRTHFPKDIFGGLLVYKEQVEIVILFKEIFLNNVIEHVINYDLDAIFEQTIFLPNFWKC